MQKRALIADNAAGTPEAVTGVLARFGFTRAEQVADVDAAIDQMRDNQFDLIVIPILDITPGQLISLEREIRKDSNVAVIATAPTADSDLIVRAMRAGVQEFLVYPPRPEEFASSVERLMRYGWYSFLQKAATSVPFLVTQIAG